MKREKIIGYGLLTVGVGVIMWTLVSSFVMIRGEGRAPSFFELDDIAVQDQEEAFENEMEKVMEEQLTAMLPSDTFPRMLNLGAWSILSFILIFGGSHLSGIGVKMIKE